MPYIKKIDRLKIDKMMNLDLIRFYKSNPGILNYIITRVIGTFLGCNPNYERFNAAIGVLECAKLELYRRMVAPYEDTKIKENGDVY